MQLKYLTELINKAKENGFEFDGDIEALLEKKRYRKILIDLKFCQAITNNTNEIANDNYLKFVNVWIQENNELEYLWESYL